LRDFSSPFRLIAVVSIHSYCRRRFWLSARFCFKLATI
jgi:hypothetical protein